MNWKIALLTIGALIALWFIALVFSADCLRWITGIMILGTLVYGIIRYWSWPKSSSPNSERGRFWRRVREYWWILIPPAVLAAVPIWYLICYTNYRGVPWVFFYYVLFLVCLLLVIGVIGLFSRQFLNQLSVIPGNFKNSGGIWRIWSIDNAPANRLMLLWCWLVFAALLYGPPSPKLDPPMAAYQLQLKAEDLKRNPNFNSVKNNISQTVGHYLTPIIGFDFSQSRPSPTPTPVTTIEKPAPRYVRGWFWIKWAFLFSPIILLALILTRRDGVARLLEGWVENFKKEKERRHARATTEKTDKTEPGAPPEDRLKFRHVLFSDLLSDVLIELLLGGKKVLDSLPR